MYKTNDGYSRIPPKNMIIRAIDEAKDKEKQKFCLSALTILLAHRWQKVFLGYCMVIAMKYIWRPTNKN